MHTKLQYSSWISSSRERGKKLLHARTCLEEFRSKDRGTKHALEQRLSSQSQVRNQQGLQNGLIR